MNSLVNLRDVAAGLPQGMLRPAVLLRSDAPLSDDLPPAWLPAGAAWPPATVIDLRHLLEKSESHPFANSATVHAISLIDPSEPGPGGPSSGEELGEFYASLLHSTGAQALARVVGVVANSSGPTLIHCLAGKDRTGVAIAMVLRLLEIPSEYVEAEYLKTNEISPDLARRLRRHYSRLSHLAREADLVTVRSVAAPPELIARVIAHWDAYPGGTAGWYLDNGGSREEIHELKRRLAP
ncbi:tyrosine-protein phosphatase [Gryllotalpicola reticulitermitis]|uniref:Tyrosine-protein phosphatase n=1 Tax=Gryllotalpicola reticulitermitis TaxID=1184153 RepID=A0ABV8Q8D3_9MICO